MSHSQVNFQYFLHQFVSHFFSIELQIVELEFNSNSNPCIWIELNWIEFQGACNGSGVCYKLIS
jgi:hypothetical protein